MKRGIQRTFFHEHRGLTVQLSFLCIFLLCMGFLLEELTLWGVGHLPPEEGFRLQKLKARMEQADGIERLPPWAGTYSAGNDHLTTRLSVYPGIGFSVIRALFGLDV